eukprot:Nitzschia sp. Nitz4//scaffold103_size77763//34328//36057//NITZ4_005443-RA/size77763-snap-gene-0.56-mRNA-1//-1//CDS//3329532322//5252//frame0
MMKRSAQTVSLMALSSVTLASSIPGGLPYIRMKDLPGVANPEAAQWTSVDTDMEFLPVDNVRLPQGSIRVRNLEEEEEEEAISDASAYRVQPFVEGIGEYDEYQQAWRMLGFMIDCNSVDYQYDNDGHHSNDQELTEDGCARYILWAAYVDLEYEGSGIAEYQYWNSTTSSWDTSACDYAENGNSRCAKMDCHLDDTHFSLLGFFKHRNYDDWMEQLFKHEGMCVWTEEEYAFMKNARKSWPQGCSYTGSQTSDGDPLYFDIKPMSKGRIAVGLYTDTKCTADYSSDTNVVEDLIGNFFVENGSGDHSGDQNQNYDFSGDTLEESQARWDAAFSVWSYCHPCVAYDITNTDGTNYLYNDDDGNRRELGGEYDAEGDLFECYDDAGYTNVNQCMKFSAKTVMQTATFRDMSLSRVQGSLADAPLAGYLNSGGEYVHDIMGAFFSYLLFAAALTCCCYNTYWYYVVKRATKYNFQGDMDDIIQQSGYDKRQGLVSDGRRTHEFA